MKRLCKTCKKEKSINNFEKTKSGWRHVCRVCRRAYWVDHFKRNPDRREKIKRSLKKRREAFRKKLWEYLDEHPCVDCKESDPIVLEFDHVRGKKKMAISHMVEGHTWSQIQEEIKKCEVRCANCHRRKTAKSLGHYVYITR